MSGSGLWGITVHEGHRLDSTGQGPEGHGCCSGLRSLQQRYVPPVLALNSRSPLPTKHPLSLATEVFNNAEAKSEGGKVLIVSISSDSGLCGGIHSSITKATKRAVTEAPEAHIVVLGDRPKAQISRTMADKIDLSFSAVGKSIPTFATASTIADEILSSGVEFDEVRLSRLSH
jgi:hypothetical protein